MPLIGVDEMETRTGRKATRRSCKRACGVVAWDGVDTASLDAAALHDQIVVLEDGRVTELGTHAELMSRGDTYHELFSLQARAYVMD